MRKAVVFHPLLLFVVVMVGHTGAASNDNQTCGGFSLAGPAMIARQVTMAMFVSLLSNLPAVGRIVEDRTGLDGLFDLTLEYTRPAPTTSDSRVAGPSVFTAIQEQLGLKLDPVRTPVDVVVIDTASLPSPD